MKIQDEPSSVDDRCVNVFKRMRPTRKIFILVKYITKSWYGFEQTKVMLCLISPYGRSINQSIIICE